MQYEVNKSRHLRKAQKHEDETREETPIRHICVPVQSKYIVKLDILVPCYHTHRQVVQSLHQFDYGIIVLKKTSRSCC